MYWNGHLLLARTIQRYWAAEYWGNKGPTKFEWVLTLIRMQFGLFIYSFVCFAAKQAETRSNERQQGLDGDRVIVSCNGHEDPAGSGRPETGGVTGGLDEGETGLEAKLGAGIHGSQFR
ncbi:hypothetical protein NDU88_005180 [Pleurodeles waltl]|uniref:Uncharacterized protein n=1 Tax=Pleurodeles waltl TaxID=8319 RepID=A0AAV7QI94_PLEWA|nr:hypothetical protein NDU88_005180 [Pleurodeles waltl]